MARVKLEMPDTYSFRCEIPIRITDLNYGGHVGNDIILSLVHEARVQYLRHYGYGELELVGYGLIMADAAIEFKQELFYGQRLAVEVQAREFTRLGFELYYRFSLAQQPEKAVAHVKTGMVCFDYSQKRPAALPDEVRVKLLES
jgi:acyl-CoA thioesterase FadM